jgi:hypothetical protein
MKLTKEDKEYLWHVLNNSHNSENSLDIEECPKDDCWYKAIIKKLGIENPRKKIKENQDDTPRHN